MESKVYLVKLMHSGETLLFRGVYDPDTQLLTSDAVVYTMQIMMGAQGHPAIVPTSNWVLGMEVSDVTLHVPSHVIYFSDNVPIDLRNHYLQAATGIVPASSVPAGGILLGGK